MATYYAITSIGNGYFIKAYGANKAAVRDAGELACGEIKTGYGTDIYVVTELKNLRVVTETDAVRKYGFRLNDPEQACYALENAVRV